MPNLKRTLSLALFGGLFMLAGLACVKAAAAQDPRGAVVGTVKDSNGAVIAGARLSGAQAGRRQRNSQSECQRFADSTAFRNDEQR